jgi:hypothetical protein
MTHLFHRSVGVVTTFRKVLLLSLVLATAFLALPTSADAQADYTQTIVPYHLLGDTQCSGFVGYGGLSVIARFPIRIDAATASASEWVGWTAVLYKYDGNGQWHVVDGTRPWMWIHPQYLAGIPAHDGYTFDRQVTGTNGAQVNAALEPGLYVVANWYWWYSTNTYHVDFGPYRNC